MAAGTLKAGRKPQTCSQTCSEVAIRPLAGTRYAELSSRCRKPPSKDIQLVDYAASDIRHVEVIRLVLAEAGNVQCRIEQEPALPGEAVAPQPPNPAAAEIPIEVYALQGRILAAAIDEASGNGRMGDPRRGVEFGKENSCIK